MLLAPNISGEYWVLAQYLYQLDDIMAATLGIGWKWCH
jgi:hypothetical protein